MEHQWPKPPTELTVLDRATHRSEELKPVREKCAAATCDKRASRSDGMCLQHSSYRLTRTEIKEAAKELLERNARTYAALHLEAARIAAAEGDAGPAERGLLLSGAIKPVPKETTEQHGGIVVNVGIALPGLGLDK